MSLFTHSKINLGLVINDTNFQLDFTEGGPEITAEIEIGSYTPEDAAVAVASALNDAGALDYTVAYDRDTREMTIAASGTFSLLVGSGSHLGTSIFGTLGFTGSNRTSAATYTGSAAGTQYATQFIAQSHVSSEDQQAAAYGTVNQSASGNVEVVSFGNQAFLEFELKFITDREMGSAGPIRTNASGVDDARTLMRYLMTKGPVEFMEDESDTSSFQKLILETSPDNSKGIGYKLHEMYDIGLPGFFKTGVLKFRVIE